MDLFRQSNSTLFQPNSISTDWGDQIIIKASLQRQFLGGLGGLTVAETAADALALINSFQDEPLAEFGSVNRLLFCENFLAPQS